METETETEMEYGIRERRKMETKIQIKAEMYQLLCSNLYFVS